MEKEIKVPQLKNTKTTSLMLPMYGKSIGYYGHQFINCFLGDKDRPEFDEHILFLFKFSGTRDFTAFEAQMKSSPYYVTDYDPTREHVVFVYKVPEEFLTDYYKFVQGSYSRISPKLKTMIIGSTTWGGTFDILTRSKTYKAKLEEKLAVKIADDAELMDPPNEREIIDASLLPLKKRAVPRGDEPYEIPTEAENKEESQ